MGRAAILTAALVALCAPALAQAGGDPELGRAKSTTCTACHGPDGRGTAPNYPVLAGQYAEYLVHALTQYRSGERKNAIMAGFALGTSTVILLLAYGTREAIAARQASFRKIAVNSKSVMAVALIAVGLAILVAVYRTRKTVYIDELNELRG